MYVTTLQPKRYHQITLEELYNTETTCECGITYLNEKSATITRCQATTPKLHNITDDYLRINTLEVFNKKYSSLMLEDMSSLYRTFYIPKHNGKMRRIDAPCDELQEAIRELKRIFEDDFGVLYHTNSYAYAKGRSTVTAVKKHERNGSRWFLKMDAKDFFPNTNIDFVMSQLEKIYPFNTTLRRDDRGQMRKALSLCFLNGGLPQGTAISPMLTNIIMIPIDYKLSRLLTKDRFIYTRYADDIHISHKYDFDSVLRMSKTYTNGLKGDKYIEQVVRNIFREEGAPFSLNSEKTHYGSSSGRNYLFGIMLNKEGKMSIGHKKKKLFKATLHSFIQSVKSGEPWSLEEVQVLNGNMSYYRCIEKDTIDDIIHHYDEKFDFNIVNEMKKILKRGEQ